MPDPELNEDGTVKEVEKTPAPDPAKEALAAVRAVADTFKDEIRKARETTPAVTVVPAVPDHSALKAEGEEVAKKFDEMVAAGSAFEATQMLMAYQEKVSRTLNGNADPTAAPGYKALYTITERAAKVEHKELFEKYADEMKAGIAALTPAERIQLDSWDKVANQIKSAHVEDILEERLRKAREGDQATLLPPTGPGQRRRVPAEETVELDELDELCASSMGFSAPEYKKLISENNRAIVKGDPKAVGMVEVLPAGLPKPGKF